jgi:exodeoxyribonuclease X
MHIIHHLNIQTIEQLYVASEEARIPKSISFGKHKGTSISDLPTDYVQWLMRQDDLDPYLRKALEKNIV